MTGSILRSVSNEVQAFLNSLTDDRFTGGVVLTKAKWNSKERPSYGMPLVLIDMNEAGESSQWLGGATRYNWIFGFNVYAYFPDPDNNDPTDYSDSLIYVIDLLRTHISLAISGSGLDNNPLWITDDMRGIENAYGFKFTLSETVPAETIEPDGLVNGWKLSFRSEAIDIGTNFTPAGLPMAALTQNYNLIQASITVARPKIIRLMLQNTNLPIAAGTYVKSILLNLKDGSPMVQIGLTLYGNEIFQESLINSFFTVTVQQYFEEDGFLYFQVSGGTINADVDLMVGVFQGQ